MHADTRIASTSTVPLDLRIALLRQYGTFSQAYSATFQPGLAHFGDDRGFLAYKMVGRTAFVLADPVAPRTRCGELIESFLREKPDAVFCQTSHEVAEILASRGFFINGFGTETSIELARYDFSGHGKRKLRLAAARAAKHGYVTKECSLASVDLNEVRAVSDAWKETRVFSRGETAFLSRPMVLDEEPDVRRFFTFDRDDRLMAFVFFDPVYEAGDVVGYLISTARTLANRDLVLHAVKRRAIETFQKEGRKWLFHGLAPADRVEENEFYANSNKFVRSAFRFLYRNRLSNRYIYNFQGLALNKRQIGGVPKQTYFAFNTLPSLPRLFKLLRACEIA